MVPWYNRRKVRLIRLESVPFPAQRYSPAHLETHANILHITLSILGDRSCYQSASLF
jgi:hypothetical protein